MTTLSTLLCLVALAAALPAKHNTVLKPGEKMLDAHDEVEETEDGNKIRFHYEKKDMGQGQVSISVSSDVLDTAEDLAEAMADVPAKDVKAKDDTAKVLGETVFKGGVEDVEELEAEDPMLEQPIEDIVDINNDLSPQQKADAHVALDLLAKADEEFAGEEEKDAAVETVLASRGDTMKQIDGNGDGVLDEKEVQTEISKDMVKVNDINFMQEQHDEKKGLASLLAILDKNKDGELTYDELFGKNHDAYQHASPQHPRYEKKMLKAQFVAADANGDKKLDLNELFVLHNLQVLQSTEPKLYFKLKALDHVAYMDTDNDGEVSWAEFKAFMLPHIKAAVKADVDIGATGPVPSGIYEHPIEEHLKKFKELFDEEDLNKDGKLDKAEMQKNLKERQEWIEQEAAKETMQVADDNKDGKVSLNEVIKNAGDYGAKTEDFFEDSELLHVGDNTSTESAMAKESTKTNNLRGGT